MSSLDISCIDCLNAVFHCYGAWHQFDRLYKDGAFDDCARPHAELQLCLKLKVAGPDEQLRIARALLREEASPTEDVIWPRRVQPPPPLPPQAAAQQTR